MNGPYGMDSKEIAERAFRFGCRIIKLYENLLKKGGAARALAPQILDSGTSIGANLEEAAAGRANQARFHRKGLHFEKGGARNGVLAEALRRIWAVPALGSRVGT